MADIDVQRLMVRLEARIDKYEQALAKANAQTDRKVKAIEQRFDQSIRKLDDAGRKMGRVYDPMLAASKRAETQLTASSARIRGALLSSASPLATGLAAGLTVDKVKDYADSYTRFKNQLKVAGLEGNNLAGTQENLYRVAQKYGVELENLGRLYGGLSVLQKDLNTTSSDSLGLTTAVAASIKIGGESSAKAAGAILGLNQALAQTRVQSDEYNQILDGARPLLLAAVQASEKYGGSLAKLKQDIEAGKVSGADLFRILQAGFPNIAAQSEKATLTIGNSFTVLNNALSKYVGETDSSLSATERLSAGIQGIANNLDLIIPALAVIGAGYGLKMARGVGTATAAQIALGVEVLKGNAVMLEGAAAAKLKSDAVLRAAQADVAAIEAEIAALRQEAAQYQVNIALANEQRAAARAAQAQAAANAAAGFGNVRVGAGDLSGSLTRAGAQASEAQAGKAALATRRELGRVNRDLEAAEAALVVATGRSTAATVENNAAKQAASFAGKAAAVATSLFTNALSLIGGSVVGGAVVLALGAIVGAVVLHNRHVKEAAENSARLTEFEKTLNDQLKETARLGRAAGDGVAGLGQQAATATPKVLAFAGAVGQLADELFRAATARRTQMIAEAEQSVKAAREIETKAREVDERNQAPPVVVASGGVMMVPRVKDSASAKELDRAVTARQKAEQNLKTLQGKKLEDFNRPEDRTGKRDLPAEIATLQKDLAVAQAGHNGSAIRDLKAQIYTLKATQAYVAKGMSFETAFSTASKEASEIKAAAEGYAARQAGKAGNRTALQEERADLQHDRRYAADLARAQDDQLQAQADLTSSTQDRLTVELARIETARKARETELADQAKSKANPSGYSPEEIAGLTKLANDTADKQKARARAVADQEIADQAVALAESDRKNRTELLQAQQGLATTVAERRSIELRILDLQQQEERARVEAIIASKTASDAEKAIARERLSILPRIEGLQRGAVERANESQLAAYRRSLIMPGAEQGDAGVVDGLQTLRSSLVSAALESGNFATVLANVGKTIGERIIGGLVDQLLIAPTAAAAEKALNALFGAADTAADAAGATAASAKAAADGAAAVSAGALATAAASATAALLTLTAAATSSAGAEGAGVVAGFLGLRGGGAIPGYAGGGGLVRGPGGPRDDAILAQLASGRFLRLSDEEYVVNAEATRRHRGLLDAINGGTLRGYAGGGAITTGGATSTVRKVNSLTFSSGLAGGGRQSVFQFDLRGAILTEELMHDINGKISAAESRAAIRGAQGGAAMAGAQMQKAATSRLGRR